MKISTGTELRILRRLAGWSQHQLGRAAGLSPGRISLFEGGFVEVTDEQKTVLSEILLEAMRGRAVTIGQILKDQKINEPALAGAQGRGG